MHTPQCFPPEGPRRSKSPLSGVSRDGCLRAVNCPAYLCFSRMDGCGAGCPRTQPTWGRTQGRTAGTEWRCCQPEAGLNLHELSIETLAGTAGEDGCASGALELDRTLRLEGRGGTHFDCVDAGGLTEAKSQRLRSDLGNSIAGRGNS